MAMANQEVCVHQKFKWNRHQSTQPASSSVSMSRLSHPHLLLLLPPFKLVLRESKTKSFPLVFPKTKQTLMTAEKYVRTDHKQEDEGKTERKTIKFAYFS